MGRRDSALALRWCFASCMWRLNDKSISLSTVQVDLGGVEKLNGHRRKKFAANRSRQEIVPSSRRSLRLNSASMPLPGAECSFASRGLHIFAHTKTEGSIHCFLDLCLQSCAAHSTTDSSHDDLTWNKSRDLLAGTSSRPAPASRKPQLVHVCYAATRQHGWNLTIRDP